VTKDSIPPEVVAELKRLRPNNIRVFGGVNSISEAVVRDLGAFARPGEVHRIGGVDRYAVSAESSRSYFNVGVPVAYVASGETFPDALAGSAAAGHQRGPVLLTAKNELPGTIETELRRLAPAKIVVLGGTNTVSESVVRELSALAPTSRMAGQDRYAGSAAVSNAVFQNGAHTVYVANGQAFPDALAGGAAAIHYGGPVLLVTKDGIPASVATELERLNPHRIVVLGGESTITAAVLNELKRYVDE
jgi:putative cell wall-binding protein